MLNLFTQLAAKINPHDANIPVVSSTNVLTGVLNVVYIAAGITAVISIILGGLFYAISAGDASKVTYARDTILYAVIGLVVVMVAFVITNFVIGHF
ncbi:hypothetical protein KBD87_02635 [Candidatus Saccharibacteria bacterium]|jgi:hypothetical protein|nr:hypothetical protein [Candidatus Saccharibacteria bacterium]